MEKVNLDFSSWEVKNCRESMHESKYKECLKITVRSFHIKCVSGNLKDTNAVGLYEFHSHLSFYAVTVLKSKYIRKCK